MENLDSQIGLYKGKYRGWMETFTGRRVNPLEFKGEDIDIRDIAHALSFVCRYGGHCKKFYSVAEHSLRVAYIAPSKYRLAGLLHDAAEAYLGDIIRPLKYNFPDMVAAEKRGLHTIFKVYGIELDHKGEELIKALDNILIATEARDLMTHPEMWAKLPQPLPGEVIPYDRPEEAEEAFLEFFFELHGGKK